MPIKILRKWERGRIQGLPNFLGTPILSQERVKLRTSNFVGAFIGRSEQKTMKNVGNSSRGRSQGVPKIQGTHIYGASRGHLCYSTAFLVLIASGFYKILIIRLFSVA